MAKKYTKEELKAAITKWADETGVPAEDRPALMKTLDHDGFAAKIAEAVLMRSDYSRVMNEEVAPLRKQLENERKQIEEWWPQAKSAYDTAVTKLARFTEIYGDLDEAEAAGRGKVKLETGEVVTKAEFDKLLKEREAAVRSEVAAESIGVTLQIQELAADHWKEFGEVLDTRPLVAKVQAARQSGDQAFSLVDAYKAEFGEKLDEKRDTARKKEIDDAVQKARIEERSRLASTPAHAVDEDSMGPFFAAEAARAKAGGKLPTEAELEQEFVRGLQERPAAAGVGSTT